jgi:tetratricopeptide (TPR) repeat protein
MLQNTRNSQEPPRVIIQSIIDTFSNGQKKEAINEIESLIKDYPLAPLLFNVSGTFYKSNGQLDIAVTKFEQALVLAPEYAEAHYNLGVTLRELDKIEEAIKSYKKAISIKNAYPSAHFNLGNALLSLKQYDGAIKHFESTIAFNPKFAQAYNNLGLLYKRLGKNQEAGKNFDKALAIKPDYAEAANFRGVIFQNDGDLENAIKYYQKSLGINPNLVDAYNNIGLAEKELNKTDNAIKAFEKALSIDPNFASAYYNLSRFKHYTLSKEQVEKMQLLLSTDGVNQSDLIYINFALASANEGFGNQDDFFKYLHEANHLRKKELNYSFGTSQKLFSIIYEIFTEVPNSIKKPLKINASTKRPIFILGMPRSGTSLVEQIISSHASVYGAGELSTLMKLLYPILKDRLSNGCDNNLSSEKNLTLIREKYLESLAHLKTSANIITDKTPANFQNIGFILSIFPDAKIIHLKRDPRAICWSIYKSNWSETGYGFSYNINDLVKFYGLYSKLMDFWHKKFPGKIYDVCYEDLTANQEQETKKLLEYCELDWDENCLNFHKNKRAVKTASSLQVREKMYQGSSEAWKKYEAHIQPLIDGLKPY